MVTCRKLGSLSCHDGKLIPIASRHNRLKSCVVSALLPTNKKGKLWYLCRDGVIGYWTYSTTEWFILAFFIFLFYVGNAIHGMISHESQTQLPSDVESIIQILWSLFLLFLNQAMLSTSFPCSIFNHDIQLRIWTYTLEVAIYTITNHYKIKIIEILKFITPPNHEDFFRYTLLSSHAFSRPDCWEFWLR